MSLPKYKKKIQTRKYHNTQRSLVKCGRTSIKNQLPSMKKCMKRTKLKFRSKPKSTKPNSDQSKEKEKEADQPPTLQRVQLIDHHKRSPKDEKVRSN
jgi:hypothetical protein